MIQYLTLASVGAGAVASIAHALNSLKKNKNSQYTTQGNTLVVQSEPRVEGTAEPIVRMSEVVKQVVAAITAVNAGARGAQVLTADSLDSLEDTSRELRAEGFPRSMANPTSLSTLSRISSTHSNPVYDAKKKKAKITTDAQAVAAQHEVMSKIGLPLPEFVGFVIPEQVVPLKRIGMPEKGVPGIGTQIASAAGPIVAGAIAGSILPGIGNVVGALVGLGISMFSKPKLTNYKFWKGITAPSSSGNYNHDFMNRKLKKLLAKVKKAQDDGKEPNFASVITPLARWAKRFQVITGEDWNDFQRSLINLSPTLSNKMNQLSGVSSSVAQLDGLIVELAGENTYYDLGELMYTDSAMTTPLYKQGRDVLFLRSEGDCYDSVDSITRADLKVKAPKRFEADDFKFEQERNDPVHDTFREELSRLQKEQSEALKATRQRKRSAKQQARIDKIKAKNAAKLARARGETVTTAALTAANQLPGASVGAEVPQEMPTGGEVYQEVENFGGYAANNYRSERSPRQEYAGGPTSEPGAPEGFSEWQNASEEYGGYIEQPLEEGEIEESEFRELTGYDGCACDDCVAHDGGDAFFTGGSSKGGVIHHGGLLNVAIAALPTGVYGRTFLNTRPFRIELAPNVLPVRQEVALTHEALHAANEMYKFKLSHDQIHSLGVLLATEILPAIESLRRFNKQN